MRRISIESGKRCSGTQRSFTSRGQFNPLHTFDVSLRKGETAKTPEEFRKLITNPGPLRICYSADYEDWYRSAYEDKCRYAEKKKAALEKLGNNSMQSMIVGAQELGVPPGMFLRPAHSIRRMKSEKAKQAAQEAIDTNIVEHGLMDCFERQPQFPSIHIDRCNDFHIRELVQELIVDHALSVDSIWEKALMYRALLKERKAAYPKSFEYIQDFVQSVVLVPKTPTDTTPKDVTSDRFPQEEWALYFEQNVKRYHIENAQDAYVFLQCHHLVDADRVLFTEPAPKELTEPLIPRQKESAFPSLKALMEDDGNLPLLRVLLFAELNTFVSTDPFKKFPQAAAVIQRPKFEHGASNGGKDAPISTLVAQKRGERFAPLSQFARKAIDARGIDIQRLQRAHSSSDLQFSAKDLNKLSEADPAAYALNGSTFFNPRTVRAEIRDGVSRKIVKGMRDYQEARRDMFRSSIDEGRASMVVHMTGDNMLPATAPTIPKFLSMIMSDPIIHFLLSTTDNAEFQEELPSAARGLAKQFFVLSIEYHLEKQRRVNRQKQLVFAAALDSLVNEEVSRVLNSADTGRAEQLRRLGSFTPFTQRALDETGFPSAARFDDYLRWMRPPK